ncbi:flavodoxin family protein [Chloroflexota bacterium]
MSILGFSSGGVGHLGNADRMVQAILEKSGYDYVFVKLTDLTFSGCKGCVDLCAVPQVCGLNDEAGHFYQKVKDAEAVVFGSSVYSGSFNTIALSFLERFFGYRHVNMALKDKPFVLVGCGYRDIDSAVEQVQNKLARQGIKVIDLVKYISGSTPCLYCGRHRECSIDGLYRMMGEASHSLTVTPDMFHRWEDDCNTVGAIEQASNKLKEHLNS